MHIKRGRRLPNTVCLQLDSRIRHSFLILEDVCHVCRRESASEI